MKEIRYRSGAPYAVAAMALFVLAAVFGMGSWVAYLLFLLGLFLLYAFLRKVVFPDRVLSVDDMPISDNPQVRELIQECEEQITEARQTATGIREPALKQRVNGILHTSVQLLHKLAGQPALQGQMRTFLRYYLPTMNKLLKIRVTLQDEARLSEANRQTRGKIDEALQMIESACVGQLAAIEHTETLNIDTEMEVLRQLNIFPDDAEKSAQVMRETTNA